MSRLPFPSDSLEFTEDTRAAIRHVHATRGNRVPAPSGFMTYAGKAGALLSDLVEHLRYHTSLSDAVTELAICIAARATNTDYIWNAHTRLALKAGVSEEALSAVDERKSLEALTADEALIIGFGRELLESPDVSDATFDAVRRRYGENGLMELVGTMGVYLVNSTILKAVRHRPEAGARLLTRP